MDFNLEGGDGGGGGRGVDEIMMSFQTSYYYFNT